MPDALPVIFGEAAAYERFMGRWSRLMAPALVRFAGVREGEDVLDVGSGTGALAQALQQAAPAARVVGIDRSPSFVSHAQSIGGNQRVRFMVGDAQHLDLPDASFDRLISLLVINFIPDPAAALREMCRVARPGATIAAAVWDYGEGMEMLRLFWDEAVALDPAIDTRDERHMPLAQRGQLGALWRAQELLDVEESVLTISTEFSSFDDYWMPFLDGQGPAGAYVKGLGESQRDALRERLRSRLAARDSAVPITLDARAWAVKGTVPARS